MGASASINDLSTVSDEDLKSGIAILEPALKIRLKEALSSEQNAIVNASSLPFETKGVHISVFKDFVEKHSGKQF